LGGEDEEARIQAVRIRRCGLPGRRRQEPQLGQGCRLQGCGRERWAAVRWGATHAWVKPRDAATTPCWREVSFPGPLLFLLLLSPPHRTVHLRLVLSELGKPVSYETQSGARAYLLIDSLLGRRRPWFYLLTPRGRGGRERNTCAEVEGHLPLPSVPGPAPCWTCTCSRRCVCLRT
jgi:hypothetical protein